MKKFIGVLLIFTAFIGLAFYINNTAEESTNIFIIFPKKTTPLERRSAVYPDIDDLTFEGIEGFSFYFARGQVLGVRKFYCCLMVPLLATIKTIILAMLILLTLAERNITVLSAANFRRW